MKAWVNELPASLTSLTGKCPQNADEPCPLEVVQEGLSGLASCSDYDSFKHVCNNEVEGYKCYRLHVR